MKKLLFLLLFCAETFPVLGQEDQDIIICSGDTLQLKAICSGAVSFKWYRDGRYLQNENSNVLVVTTAGVYDAKGMSAEGCLSYVSNKIHIRLKVPYAVNDSASITANRSIVVSVLQNDIAGCVPFENATIRIVRDPVQGSVTIDSDRNVIFYKANPYAEGEDSFSYQVTDQKGFVTNAAIVYIFMNLDCATVFPNPARDKLEVSINNRYISELRLLDFTGKKLYSTSVLHRPDITIDLRSYADGIYIVQLLNAYQELYCVFKVVKQTD